VIFHKKYNSANARRNDNRKESGDRKRKGENGVNEARADRTVSPQKLVCGRQRNKLLNLFFDNYIEFVMFVC
jgi:hypothetical protein